jgi:hypothetical protein
MILMKKQKNMRINMIKSYGHGWDRLGKNKVERKFHALWI